MSEPTEDVFPKPPQFSDELVSQCRSSHEFRPILFEWYKYVAIVANFVARIELSSPSIKEIPPIRFAALVGLLNRCSRLMLANVTLSHGGLYGETTALIDRCIFESCVKVLWLCRQRDQEEAFSRFFADGFKAEIELREGIQGNISERGGAELKIETRMLRSIGNFLETTGMTEAQVRTTKKLDDLASMVEAIGWGRESYVISEKLGSHHVHGTWPGLIACYLESAGNGLYSPRDHDVPTHVNQYFSIAFEVLEAVKGYCAFIFKEEEDIRNWLGLFDSIEDEIIKVTRETAGDDFEEVARENA